MLPSLSTGWRNLGTGPEQPLGERSPPGHRPAVRGVSRELRRAERGWQSRLKHGQPPSRLSVRGSKFRVPSVESCRNESVRWRSEHPTRHPWGSSSWIRSLCFACRVVRLRSTLPSHLGSTRHPRTSRLPILRLPASRSLGSPQLSRTRLSILHSPRQGPGTTS